MSDPARRKRVAGFVGLGLILYLLFLLASAPAAWMAEAAARLSNGQVTLARPSGTLWSGTGELHAGSPASGVRELGTLQWRINPAWLLIGRAQFRLQLDGPTTHGQAAVRLARHRIELDELSADIPANIISLVYGPAAFFEPSGTIQLRSPEIELSAEGLKANVEVHWQGAGGRFTGPGSLGDYRVDVNGAGETAAIRLTTLRGDLELTGEGQWQVTGDGTLRFRGSAAPKGDAMKLEPLLRTLGRDLGNGRREIRFNGQFPLIEQLGFG